MLEDSGDDADNEDDEVLVNINIFSFSFEISHIHTHTHTHTHTQEDPEVIEGDEEDTLTIDDGVTGETLLASEYQVSSHLLHSHLELILFCSMRLQNLLH